MWILSDSFVLSKIVSEYDQEIPQSQTADYPMAPRGRAAQPSRDTEDIKLMQCTIMENTLIKLTLRDETKKRAHDSQIVRSKENLKLSLKFWFEGLRDFLIANVRNSSSIQIL